MREREKARRIRQMAGPRYRTLLVIGFGATPNMAVLYDPQERRVGCVITTSLWRLELGQKVRLQLPHPG